MAGGGPRTEKATNHKLRLERPRGKLFPPPDIFLAGGFLVGIAPLKWNMGSALEQFRLYFKRLFTEAIPPDFNLLYLQNLIAATALVIAKMVGLPIGLACVLRLAGQIAQGGWNLAAEGFAFSPGRLLPKNNF